MNSKQLKLVPIGLVLALGSGQALAESGWYRDSNTGALVINANPDGSRSAYDPSNQPVNAPMAPDGRWYHDEYSDTIVYNVEGSRSGYSRSKNTSTKDALSPMQTWYYDPDKDTIVYNVEGSRSGYKGARSSM